MAKKIDTTTVGGRIYELRRAMKMSQDELAEKTGVGSRVSISQYETGVRIPSTDNIIELARVLSTSTDYLLTGRNISDNNNSELIHLFSEIKSEKYKELIKKHIRLVLEMEKEEM